MEKIAEVFYTIIFPVLLTSGFGIWMFRLQRKESPKSLQEADVLFEQLKTVLSEVQEERDKLKLEFAKIENYKADCDEKIEKYRLQVTTVMDNEMEKRRQLETKLDKEISEKAKLKIDNDALKALVNNLTEKLAIAQEQIMALNNELQSVRDELTQLKREHPEIEKKTEESKENEDKTTPDV